MPTNIYMYRLYRSSFICNIGSRCAFSVCFFFFCLFPYIWLLKVVLTKWNRQLSLDVEHFCCKLKTVLSR